MAFHSPTLGFGIDLPCTCLAVNGQWSDGVKEMCELERQKGVASVSLHHDFGGEGNDKFVFITIYIKYSN